MPLRRLPTWPAGVARRSEESANTSRRAIAALPPHLAIRELPSTGRSIGRPRAVVPQSLARRGVSTIEIAGRASRASARSRPARNSRTHARSSLLIRQGMYEQRPPSQRARIVSSRPSNQPPSHCDSHGAHATCLILQNGPAHGFGSKSDRPSRPQRSHGASLRCHPPHGNLPLLTTSSTARGAEPTTAVPSCYGLPVAALRASLLRLAFRVIQRTSSSCVCPASPRHQRFERRCRTCGSADSWLRATRRVRNLSPP